MSTMKILLLPCLIVLLTGCGGGAETISLQTPSAASFANGSAFPMGGPVSQGAPARNLPAAVVANPPPSQPDPFPSEGASP